MTILLFFLIISVLVFVHEWGHFFAARRSGVAVEEFGFGFPPRLVSFRRGATTWSINLIPFGGFVKLQGEQQDAAQRPDSFVSAPRRKKFMILAAGVIMNYVLAWVLLSTALAAGVPASQDTLPTDRWYRFTPGQQTLLIGPDSPSARAGLRQTDSIVTINGQTFATTEQLITYVQKNNYPDLLVEFRRSGTSQTLTVKPGPTAPRYGIGITTDGRLTYPWYVAPWFGLVVATKVVGQTFAGLGQLGKTLVTTGRVSADVTGPIGIAVLTNQVSRLGWIALIQFTAIISVSLAVLNFLPIPALDGGRALFLVIEIFRGRPVNQRVEAVIHTASFYALLLFILFISVRDFERFNLLTKLRHVWK